MREMVELILSKYGTQILLRRGEETAVVRGFFQPVSSTSWQSVGHAVSPLGYTNRAEHLCIVPAEPEIRDGDTLEIMDRKYLVQRVESYCYGDRTVYRWVLCVEKGVEQPWGN